MVTKPQEWWTQPGVVSTMMEFHERSVPFMEPWNERSKADQYKTRKSLYRPGDIFTIPTRTGFGGNDDLSGLAVVASCNWLGLVQLFVVDQWIAVGESIGVLRPADVVEVWWGGDGFFLSGIYDVVAHIEGFDFDEWPAPIGPLPRGRNDGMWLSYFKPRRLVYEQELLSAASKRRPLTLFTAKTLDALSIRTSERLQWSVDGTSPHPELDPGSDHVARTPQSWNYLSR